MNTCTGLNGHCVAGDLWSHESIHTLLADGSELYVAQYLNHAPRILLQKGFAVRRVTADEAERLVGPAAAPLLRLLPAGETAAA
ncbi:hypothetical protein [Kitasatospora sp. NPDC047058]|uniref:hypothetical protein n=1 Tax=Kitasatospora sp. NPDC047058 TaxID=3155620 RepID=UPI0033CA902E